MSRIKFNAFLSRSHTMRQMGKFSIITYQFTKQQLLFQVFKNTTVKPLTHTTVGALVRIKENYRVNAGSYIYRINELPENHSKLFWQDRKPQKYFFQSDP